LIGACCRLGCHRKVALETADAANEGSKLHSKRTETRLALWEQWERARFQLLGTRARLLGCISVQQRSFIGTIRLLISVTLSLTE
jgi:hypothetical protein